MSDKHEESNDDELQADDATLLPDREAMSVITPTGEDVLLPPPGHEEPGLPPPRD